MKGETETKRDIFIIRNGSCDYNSKVKNLQYGSVSSRPMH